MRARLLIFSPSKLVDKCGRRSQSLGTAFSLKLCQLENGPRQFERWPSFSLAARLFSPVIRGWVGK